MSIYLRDKDFREAFDLQMAIIMNELLLKLFRIEYANEEFDIYKKLEHREDCILIDVSVRGINGSIKFCDIIKEPRKDFERFEMKCKTAIYDVLRGK